MLVAKFSVYLILGLKVFIPDFFLTGILNNHIELNVLVEGYKKVCKDSFLFCSSIIHKKKIFSFNQNYFPKPKKGGQSP